MKAENIKGFTLIEIIVSIAVLSMIMISVFTIFSLSADLNNKTDISRALQENIKNLEQIIIDDIKINNISGVNSDIVISNCQISLTSKYSSGTKLCVGTNSYYLARQEAGTWIRIGNYNECELGINSCYLVKHDENGNITQLSNSWLEFRKLYFYVTNDKIKKVSINFEVQPSIHKGIKPELVKNNKINFETTISERLYNNN
ncbi:MAG: prepilin-type N-terminal cleavage/methylation domain-containing protein [Candidatus Gracilibacteria bacterium]|nr:prepilin-type N-terminal cleavage/methylation domain-containing protein [Candidatus Gracilibacteria bacterium]